MRKLTAPCAIAVAAILAAGCSAAASSSSSSSAPAATHAAKAKAKAKPCKLKTTFDYIERDDDPGASVMAAEIGNVNLSDCTDSLKDFRATAGQGPGECTTIALASRNPGYDVSKVPAPKLKHVIESAGPGC